MCFKFTFIILRLCFKRQRLVLPLSGIRRFKRGKLAGQGLKTRDGGRARAVLQSLSFRFQLHLKMLERRLDI